MSTTYTQGNEASLYLLEDKVRNIVTNIDIMIDDIDTMISKIDQRLPEYYSTDMGNITTKKTALSNHKMQEFGNWLNTVIGEYKSTKEYTEQIDDSPSSDLGGSIPSPDTTNNNTPNLDIENPNKEIEPVADTKEFEKTDLTPTDIDTEINKTPTSDDSSSNSPSLEVDKLNTDNLGNNKTNTEVNLDGNNNSNYKPNENINSNNNKNNTGTYRYGASYSGKTNSGTAKNELEGLEASVNSAQKSPLESLFGKSTTTKQGSSSSVKPIAGNSNTKGASIGVGLTGLAGLGSLAGGGYLVGKKVANVKFDQRDWNALSEEVRDKVLTTLKTVGFTEEEINTLQTATFKVKLDELSKHGKKIKKAYENNIELDNLIKEKYGFTVIGNTGKIIKYQLFLILIIDGKNSIDDYNIYNILNESFIENEDTDFTYMGLNMDECIVREEEQEDIQIMNDPTQLTEAEQTNDDKPFSAKDWLKEIGIDDN